MVVVAVGVVAAVILTVVVLVVVTAATTTAVLAEIETETRIPATAERKLVSRPMSVF